MKSRSRRGGKKQSRRSVSGTGTDASERLQKVLARAGVGSRRACEQLIEEGRVEVDGKVVTELGTRVDVATQKIRVDGELQSSHHPIYYMVNKPVGVVSTNRDPEGRMRVIDLIHSDIRLFPVGRLDRTSEGLILVTNDGHLANCLTHPRYRVPKTYLVRVVGRINYAEIQKLMQGVHLAEGYARPESIHIKRHYRQSTDLEMVLREGRNREIRRLLARVGHKVISLCRTGIGEIKLGSLPSGSYRRLTPAEIRKLEKFRLHAASEGSEGSRGRGRPRRQGGAGKKLARSQGTGSTGKGTAAKKKKARRGVVAGKGTSKGSQGRGRQRNARSAKKSTGRKRSSSR